MVEHKNASRQYVGRDPDARPARAAARHGASFAQQRCARARRPARARAAPAGGARRAGGAPRAAERPHHHDALL